MNRQKTILLLPLIGIIFLSTSCSLSDNSDNVQINQIRDFYPVRSHSNHNKSDTYNVLDLNKKTKCGPARAMLSPASLGVDETTFDKMWVDLRNNTGQERFYKFTYGQCIDDGVLITKIVDCAEGKCGKEYTSETDKIWLNTWAWAGEDIPLTDNGQYKSAEEKDNAQYFIQLPLKEAPEKSAWEFEIRYTKHPDIIAMKGYIDNSQFLMGHFILEYQAFYGSGSLYHQGTYDRQGRQQGKSTYFYDKSGKVRSVSYYQDGKLEGESISYHEDGKIAGKRLFKGNNEITKNGISYADNGQIIRKYSYNDSGLKNGTETKYYPDGTVQEIEHYVNGILTGKNETYWPDAKIKTRKIYNKGKLVSEEIWLQNGNKEQEYHYDSKRNKVGFSKTWHNNGQLRSNYYNKGNQYITEFFYENGKPHSRNIDANNNPNSREEWYENGKPKIKQLYKKGKMVSYQEWYENGNLRIKDLYKNEQFVSREEWRNNGKISERSLYKNGELSRIEKYDENGTLKEQYNYKR